METLSLKHLISPVHGNFHLIRHQTNRLVEGSYGTSLLKSSTGKQIGCSKIVSCSKQFAFQDFQDFTKPQRLLPASEVNIWTESSLEETFSSFGSDEYCSLYIVELQTSRESGSSLSDLNAAILLCLIDVNGDSILQRIHSTPSENPQNLKEMVATEHLCFQRGSIDKITFKGPKLEKVEALWIGVESGYWRLGGISLTIISQKQSLHNSAGDGKLLKYCGLNYDFGIIDTLLGEGDGVSMLELRPCRVAELDKADSSTVANMGFSPSMSLSEQKILNEESMKDYADLKFSLLLYDAMLIFTGTSLAAFSTSERAAVAFLFGGVSGFLYLLLLQKSVDGLPAPALSTMNRKPEGTMNSFGEFKGPLSTLALILASTAVVGKYGFGSETIAFTPQDLFVGVAGFVTCKIAVVLAAFKPVPLGLKQNK